MNCFDDKKNLLKKINETKETFNQFIIKFGLVMNPEKSFFFYLKKKRNNKADLM